MPTCKGRKKDGDPCKSPIVLDNGYCVVHQDQARGVKIAAESIRWTRERLEAAIADHGGPNGLDLAGADLSGLDLSGMDLHGAVLSRWDEESDTLLVADLEGASLRRANLRKARLGDADLQGVDLWRANLQRAYLWRSNLQEARLPYADLQGAHLGGANLHEANLEGVNLQGTHLQEVKLYRAKLDHTALKREQLGAAIWEERAEEYQQAREVYLALKRNFEGLGDYDAASWAYRKERRVEKLGARQKAGEALGEGQREAAVAHYAKFASHQLAEWICDYGESVPRVLGSLLVVYVLFALIYGLTGSVVRVDAASTAAIGEPTQKLVDLARFSLGAMTTMNPVGLEPRNGLVELLAVLEALLSITLTGLLGFVVGSRIRRS